MSTLFQHLPLYVSISQVPSGMHTPQSICIACRLRLFASVHGASTIRPRPRVTWNKKLRNLSTSTTHRINRSDLSTSQTANKSAVKPWAARSFSTREFDVAKENRAIEEENLEVNVEDEAAHDQEGPESFDSLEALREQTAQHDPEFIATAARQAFGDRLPQGALTSEQYKIYERLYGTPLGPLVESEVGGMKDRENQGDNVLLREGENGLLEEIDFIDEEYALPDESELPGDAEVPEARARKLSKRSYADDQLQKDIVSSMQQKDQEVSIRSPDDLSNVDEDPLHESEAEDLDASDTGEAIRAHPFTLASRFGTSPSTLPLPRAAMTEPINLLLSSLSNKHIDETAERLFGGPGLPYSPSTPISSRIKPQKPIPIHPSQGRMSDIEADVYLAAVMPGTYAAVTSALTEIRRRLGSQWLEQLLRKKGGPSILDAGAGGAGVLAWREVLKAEWHGMRDSSSASFDASHTSAISDQISQSGVTPAPLGKATVLTSSSALRHRASVLLENTTFLPRLPDYIHATFPSEDTHRKQYDIIVAPHSLWHLQESYERKQLVLNLWNLLNPKGGILVLLEKGVPRGFEVVADARNYLLDELFERKDVFEETDAEESGDTIESIFPETLRKGARIARRASGRILAPCPNHSKCPLYLVPGVSRQRKDYCHFSQRFIRPTYLQRMLGAKERNYDDVEFSYVAVQKGINSVEDPALDNTSVSNKAGSAKQTAKPQRLTGKAATDRAFEGYDFNDTDLDSGGAATATMQHPPRIPNPLPRIVLPPLKRHGHVHLDMCLPSGQLERWTVPRSFGRQPYRDARKARWGDLWPLGAKQREPRRVRLGLQHMEQGIGTGRGARSLGGGGDDEDGDGVQLAGGKTAKSKDRGRLKARKRRREETKALLENRSDV